MSRDKSKQHPIVNLINTLCTRSDFGALDERIVPEKNRERDQNKLKEIKKTLKTQSDAVHPTIATLMRHFRSKDAENRLVALRISAELFARMHMFRKIISEEHIGTIVKCTCGNAKLPDPKATAKALRKEAAKIISEWCEKYSEAYPQLSVIEEYIQSHNESVEGSVERVEEEERRQREVQASEMRQRLFEKIKPSVEQLLEEVQQCENELKNACEAVFGMNVDYKEALNREDKFDSEKDNIHAISVSDSVTICIDTQQPLKTAEGADVDTALRTALEDSLKLIKRRHLPTLTEMLRRVQRLSNGETIKKLIDARQSLELWQRKIESLGFESIEARANRHSSDDEFEEVDEKLDALDSNVQVEENLPSTSKFVHVKPEICAVNIKTSDGPTTSTSNNQQSVPIVPFGLDIKYWGDEESKEAPQLARNDADCHRFWRPNETELSAGTACSSQHLNAYNERMYTYIGKVEPIKHRCNALLPSGKRCPRQDRVKCPFHGPIKAEGTSEGEVQQPSTSQAQITRPWNNTELLRDIEQQTGQNLGSTTRKGAKSNTRKERRKPSEKAAQVSRLQRKLFNAKSLKRVGASMDAVQNARNQARFQHQFSYAVSER